MMGGSLEKVIPASNMAIFGVSMLNFWGIYQYDSSPKKSLIHVTTSLE